MANHHHHLVLGTRCDRFGSVEPRRAGCFINVVINYSSVHQVLQASRRGEIPFDSVVGVKECPELAISVKIRVLVSVPFCVGGNLHLKILAGTVLRNAEFIFTNTVHLRVEAELTPGQRSEALNRRARLMRTKRSSAKLLAVVRLFR